MEFQVDLSRWRAVFSLCCLLGLIYQNDAIAQPSADGYLLGRGYRLANTGIQLGGYASIGAQGLGSIPWSIGVHDLSLFTSWSNGKNLSFFSELEVEDALTVSENQSLTTNNTIFLVERLFVDYRVYDAFSIRLGKMLTPVGQWNLIHADPLVWTSTRPVATQNLFPEHATGIMLHGTVPIGDRTLDYSLYGDYTVSLDPKKNKNEQQNPHTNFHNAVGLRLVYNPSDTLFLGFSYADFSLFDNPTIRNHLVGLDLAWDYYDFSVSSEIVYRQSDDQINNRAWQGYFQGVAPVKEHVYAIGRYEFFDQPSNRFGQVAVLGLAYRPMPPMTLKLEYRLGENNKELAPEGLFTSLAVLF